MQTVTQIQNDLPLKPAKIAVENEIIFPLLFHFCKKKIDAKHKKTFLVLAIHVYICMRDLTVEAHQMLSHILILLSTEFSNPISRYDVQHGQMGDDFHVVRAQKVLFKASIFYHCSCHFFVFPFAAAHLLEYGIYVYYYVPTTLHSNSRV